MFGNGVKIVVKEANKKCLKNNQDVNFTSLAKINLMKIIQ